MSTNESSKVIVESVIELTASQMADIKQILEQKLNHSITLENRHNKSLIGGLKLIIGDQVVNLSLAHRLQTIHQSLTKI